jgi:hypothetical protein
MKKIENIKMNKFSNTGLSSDIMKSVHGGRSGFEVSYNYSLCCITDEDGGSCEVQDRDAYDWCVDHSF